MHLCITGIVGKQERIISMKFNTVVTFREGRRDSGAPSLFVMCYFKNLRQMWKILRSVMLGAGAGYLFEILFGVHFCMLKSFKINTKKDSVLLQLKFRGTITRNSVSLSPKEVILLP